MRHTIRLAPLLFLAIALLAPLPAHSAATAARPNIILCMTDDQGWGDTSYNGLKRIQTPNLDAMAHRVALLNKATDNGKPDGTLAAVRKSGPC